MRENKIYKADEVKRIHSERNQKKQEARDAKCDVAVKNAASWITQCLEESDRSYIKLKASCVKSKLGNGGWMWSLEQFLKEQGYEVRRPRVKEHRWWTRKVFEVDYYVVGYNKSDIDFAFPK